MTLRSTLHVASALTLLAVLAGGSLAQESKSDLTTKPAAGQTPPPPAGLGPRAGAAPAGAPPEPKTETIATNNGWIVQCSEIPAQNGQPAGKACGMVRSLKNEGEPPISVMVIVRRSKGEDAKIHTVMETWAPIGTYLPTGVAMEIDGSAIPGRMPFVRCAPTVCIAQGEAQDDSLKKFTKGKQGVFYIYDRPGHGYPLKFPLQGFAEGLTALDKVAIK